MGVAVLGLVDAAYSGDWSRIGVLTTAQEQQLQQAVMFVAAVNAFCTLAVVVLQRSPAVAFKALLTGPFALAEALYTTTR